MAKHIARPKLTQNKKTGQRYLTYKNKRYIINSRASNAYIIKNFLDIIKVLLKKRTRKKTSASKKQIIENKPPEISGTSSSKIESYRLTNELEKQKKI